MTGRGSGWNWNWKCGDLFAFGAGAPSLHSSGTSMTWHLPRRGSRLFARFWAFSPPWKVPDRPAQTRGTAKSGDWPVFRLRIGESITVVVRKGTVPFSSSENRDSPPLIHSPVLKEVRYIGTRWPKTRACPLLLRLCSSPACPNPLFAEPCRRLYTSVFRLAAYFRSPLCPVSWSATE
jgi:hypothetical protein